MSCCESNLLPTSIFHDDSNHNCGCVKCYFNKITLGRKILFIWLTEYKYTFLVLNAITTRIKPSWCLNSISSRSPPA